MPGQLSIRRAQLHDAETLAGLAARTFRDAFSADNEPRDMEAYMRQAFSVARMRVELADSDNTFLLALIEGNAEPAGYAKLRAGTPEVGVRGPSPIEIERLYVDQVAIGQGLGAGLMRACLERAEAAGYRTVWLGVWERNVRAIRFYERWGFETVGTHAFRLGSDDQVDLLMERSISNAR